MDILLCACSDHSANKASESKGQEEVQMHATQRKSLRKTPQALSTPMPDVYHEPTPLLGKEGYKTITVPFIKDQSNDLGMLFRLWPPSRIQTLDAHQKAVASPEPIESSTYKTEFDTVIHATPEQKSVNLFCTETDTEFPRFTSDPVP